MRQPMNSRHAIAIAAVTAALLATAACGGNSGGDKHSDGASAAASAVPSLAAMVPSQFAHKTIKVGVIQGPPYSIIGAHDKITGADNELMEAAAAKLGLKIEYVTTKSAEVVTGLAADRFDAITMRGDFVERHASSYTIDTQKSTSTWLLEQDKKSAYTSVADVCGKKMAMQQGTIANQVVASMNKLCGTKGRSDVHPSFFPDSNSMDLALRSGRVDIIFDSVATNLYVAKQSNGQLVNAQFPDSASLPGFGDNLLGTAFGHDKKALADAFVAAVKATVTDGTYHTIFDKYGVASLQVTADQVKINGSDKSLG